MLSLLAQAATEESTAVVDAGKAIALALGIGLGSVGAGIGIGLALIGAGIGLGRIGGSVAESIARQPEAVGDIRGAGLLFAVLLEGATIIAMVFALLFKFIK
jgi:F-type H+-transporting ATPase subunit c